MFSDDCDELKIHPSRQKHNEYEAFVHSVLQTFRTGSFLSTRQHFEHETDRNAFSSTVSFLISPSLVQEKENVHLCVMLISDRRDSISLHLLAPSAL